jgi:hypothetical protein
MTSEQKVKEVYPEAFAKYVEGSPYRQCFDIVDRATGITLGGAVGRVPSAWVAAWQTIERQRIAKGAGK